MISFLGGGFFGTALLFAQPSERATWKRLLVAWAASLGLAMIIHGAIQ